MNYADPDRQLDEFLSRQKLPISFKKFADSFLLTYGYRVDDWNRSDLREKLKKRKLIQSNGMVNK